MKRLQPLPLLAVVLLAACASKPVTPPYAILKDDGYYQTSGLGASQDDSEKAANSNATQTCLLQKRTAVVSKMSSQYQGALSEGVNKTVDAVSSILKSTTGKSYGSTANEKDYKTTMEFRCQ